MISKRPTLIPYLFVNDAEISIEFYRRCFGMELIKKSRDENNQIIHMEMTFKDALIMLAPEGACGETAQTPNHRNAACPVTLYLYCEDPDGIYATAIQGGAKCRIAPKDMFWGERVCEVEDLDGYQWTFAKPLDQAEKQKSA